MPTIESALIVGGGIAGLTSALALSRQGISCTVLELHTAPAGAAITIQNRAVDALAELCLLDRVLEEGACQRQDEIFRYFDSSGVPIPTPPMPPQPENGLPSAIVIHRVLLARILREAAQAAGAVVRDGLTITGLAQDDEAVTATLSDGSVRAFDLVVGADGVLSTTRSLVFGDDVAPRYSGTTMFRWVVRDVPEAGPTGFYRAKDLLVLVRLRGGSVYLATGRHYGTQPEHFSQEQARGIVREHLEQFDAPLPTELLRALDDQSAIVVNHYHWLMTPDPWFRGRVVIIGDAAHATTAHLASGGGMAIEDSVVLGQELSRGGPVSEVLQRFMARRFERTRVVVETSVELGEMLKRGEPVSEQNAVRGRALASLKEPY